MTHVKTAVSVQEELFSQAEQVARELNVSRSHLFALALEEFIARYRNRQLLQQINDAYSDAPDAQERLLLQKLRRSHKRLAEGEWK